MTESEKKNLQAKIDGAESEARAQMVKVNDLRKQMPAEEVEDYALVCSETGKTESLSKAFGDKDELIVIHNMGAKCPGCTAWADGFNGIYQHVRDRAGFLVTSPDDAKDQLKFKRSRGWTFPMASTKGNAFTKEMGFTGEDVGYGPYRPGISVFKKTKAGKIVRSARASICPNDEYSPIYSLLNLTEKGSEGWFPKFHYESSPSPIDAALGQYYEGWNQGNFDQMEKVLAANLHFRGPMEQHDSSKSFIASCQEMAKQGAFDKFKLTQGRKFVQGDEAVLLYELKTESGEPIPMAEYFRLNEGKISEINLYFDSKRFSAPSAN